MESQNNYSSNKLQRIIFAFFALFLIASILFFKNTIFKSTLQLRNLSNLSMDPEIAFTNGKPTYLEFYAEWCEICKEMAPAVTELKKDFDNEINFVFLNVDNPIWDKFIKQFNVNGIPQINILDAKKNVNATFTGLQEEKTLRDSINYLLEGDK
tara:strand:+ start:162 stop:623 length:462 start_codon:yes stop_codon:yes gene_type:complete